MTTRDDLYGQLRAAHDEVKEAEEAVEAARAHRIEIATQLRTAHKIRDVRLDGKIMRIAQINAAERATAKANGEDPPDALYDVAVPRDRVVLGDVAPPVD